MVTFEQVRERLLKIERIEDKIKYLETLLKKIKDKKLAKKIEELLKALRELEKKAARGTLEEKFLTETPAPELPKPTELELPSAPRSPAAPREREQSLLENYVSPSSPPEERAPKPTRPVELYRIRVAYIPKATRESIREILESYLKAEKLRPEELVRSPELRAQAAEKIYEMLGGEIADRYAIEQQIEYEAEKFAHPETQWEWRPDGWITYKGLKGEKPRIVEEA